MEQHLEEEQLIKEYRSVKFTKVFKQMHLPSVTIGNTTTEPCDGFVLIVRLRKTKDNHFLFSSDKFYNTEPSEKEIELDQRDIVRHLCDHEISMFTKIRKEFEESRIAANELKQIS